MANSGGFIGLVVAVVLVIGAGIPIAQQVINTANLTGITATIVGFVPVFMAVAILALAAGLAQ
jgi:hypothetical protein